MSRHGKRAEDKALLSASIPKSLKLELQRLAKSQKRTLSNFVLYHLDEIAGGGHLAEEETPPSPKIVKVPGGDHIKAGASSLDQSSLKYPKPKKTKSA
jgi:hypothetical protein